MVLVRQRRAHQLARTASENNIGRPGPVVPRRTVPGGVAERHRRDVQWTRLGCKQRRRVPHGRQEAPTETEALGGRGHVQLHHGDGLGEAGDVPVAQQAVGADGDQLGGHGGARHRHCVHRVLVALACAVKQVARSVKIWNL